MMRRYLSRQKLCRGKDLQKELVKDVEGNYIVQIPPGKKFKGKG